jgi:hypothetical protein
MHHAYELVLNTVRKKIERVVSGFKFEMDAAQEYIKVVRHQIILESLFKILCQRKAPHLYNHSFSAPLSLFSVRFN